MKIITFIGNGQVSMNNCKMLNICKSLCLPPHWLSNQQRRGSNILANVCIPKCDNFTSGQTERCHVFVPVFVECLATSGLVIYDSCRSTGLNYFPSQQSKGSPSHFTQLRDCDCFFCEASVQS